MYPGQTAQIYSFIFTTTEKKMQILLFAAVMNGI